MVRWWLDGPVTPVVPQPSEVVLPESSRSVELPVVLHLLGGGSGRRMAHDHRKHRLVQLQLVESGGQEDHVRADLLGNGCLVANDPIEHADELVLGKELVDTNQLEHQLK